MGGMFDDFNLKDYFWSYDVENNKWKVFFFMFILRYVFVVFEIDNKLYVIGSVFYVIFYWNVWKFYRKEYLRNILYMFIKKIVLECWYDNDYKWWICIM